MKKKAWNPVESRALGLFIFHASCTDLGVKHDWNYIGTCMRPLISEHMGGGAAVDQY